MQTPSTDFSEQNLAGQSFAGMDLSGYNFSGAVLRECNFAGCNLQRANFNNAEFSGTNFIGSNWWEAEGWPANRTGLIFHADIYGHYANTTQISGILDQLDEAKRNLEAQRTVDCANDSNLNYSINGSPASIRAEWVESAISQLQEKATTKQSNLAASK